MLLAAPGRFALRTFALSPEARSAGTPDGGRTPVDAAEAVRTRLLQEVTRSLLHFQWRSGMGRPRQVWLDGDGARLPGLIDALQAKLNVPVEMSDVRAVIDWADDAVERSATAHGQSLLDLVGAASTHYFPDHPIVNLLPVRAQQQATQRTRRPWRVASALLAGSILLPPLVHFRQVRDEAGRKSAAIERELAPWNALEARNQKNLQRLAALNRQIAAIDDTASRRTSWLRLLASLQDRLSQVEDVWFEKLEVSPAVAGAPMKLMVSGRMLDRAHPLARISPETFARVRDLLARLVAPPFVAIEGERFDHQHPGILKFDFVLVADGPRPL